MAEERGEERFRREEGVSFAVLNVPPQAVGEELARYRDTIQTAAAALEGSERLLGKLKTFTTLLDNVIGQLTGPYTLHATFTVPPVEMSVAFKSYMTALLVEVMTIIDGMQSELYEAMRSALTTRSEKDVQVLVNLLEAFDSSVSALTIAIIILLQRLSNILARNLPPTARSHVTNEMIGKMLVPAT